jgi:hypothetical protein
MTTKYSIRRMMAALSFLLAAALLAVPAPAQTAPVPEETALRPLTGATTWRQTCPSLISRAMPASACSGDSRPRRSQVPRAPPTNCLRARRFH